MTGAPKYAILRTLETGFPLTHLGAIRRILVHIRDLPDAFYVYSDVKALRLLIPLILTILALVNSGCPRQEVVGPAEKVEKPTAAQEPASPEKALKAEFRGAEIIWDDEEGARVMEAKFEEAIASQTGAEAEVELRGVKANLYKDGEAAVSISAPRVVTDSRTREVRASGGVSLTSAADGTSARADQLTWKSKEDKLIGKGSVRMKRENLDIQAGSFQADTSLNRVRFINGEVKF